MTITGGDVVIKAVCAHNWIDATCTAPKTCSSCGATEGEPTGGHVDANNNIFNPMAYCQGVSQNSDDQELKTLVRALYLYNQAANAYFQEI